MRNIPSKEEVIGYINKDKKTIFLTMVLSGILFSLLIAYSLYSQYSELTEEDQFLSQEEVVEILEKEPEEVSVEEVREIEEALEQNRYSFGVLIEREDQSLYNYPDLITEFLISEELVSYVEENTGETLLPSPELAVEVSEDSQTKIQYIMVGTANEEDNIALAQAYYQAFQNNEMIPALEDKLVYMMDEEPFLVEEETWMDIVFEQIQLFSPLQTIVGLFISLVLGFFLGVAIVLLHTILRKEIPFMYELKEEESDKVIYMNKLKGLDTQDLYRKLAHSILMFPNNEKLILSQKPIKEELFKEIRQQENSYDSLQVKIVKDVEESENLTKYDEVIILVDQNNTTKAWYRNQRIQLERVEMPVTIYNFVIKQ